MRARAQPRSDALPTVAVACAPSALAGFGALLQRGVAVPATTGVSVAAFLTEQLRVDPGTIANRISTVFLDGSVVDCLERAVLRPGSVLALSAAMPGLVGATLRRGGFYASMRADITRADDAPVAAEPCAGTIQLKLFNLLIAELGPLVLARGLLVSPAEARAALPPGHPTALPASTERILLRVSLDPEVSPCP